MKCITIVVQRWGCGMNIYCCKFLMLNIKMTYLKVNYNKWKMYTVNYRKIKKQKSHKTQKISQSKKQTNNRKWNHKNIIQLKEGKGNKTQEKNNRHVVTTDWMFVPFPQSICWKLILSIIFGGETFGRWSTRLRVEPL